jgi:glycosyltransferase involved in cell wall biosynthesis
LGALTNGKGIRDAIRAFGEASPDDWSLLCAGRGTPGYEREVNALLRVVPGGNRVTLCGLLDSRRIVTLFQESPVFLLPSYMDTGPTALKEAIAMGLWPVCYDNSGPKELIERYRWGTLSPTGDISALTENLRRAFRDRPWQDRGRMTRCVRQARYDLSRETVWGRLLECYTEAYWACRDKAQDKRWGDR